MAGSVYWVGADGNIWFKDSSGTRNVGKPTGVGALDNGFDAEFLSAEATRIDDPVSRPTVTNTTGTAPAPKVVNTAAVNATQQAIDSLGTEEQVGNQNIDAGYGSLIGRYDMEKGRAEGDYTEQTVTNNQNLQKNRQNELVAAAQGSRGLRGVLAGMGALSGDGMKLANRAVTSEANEGLGKAADTATSNAQMLDKSIGRFREEDEVRRNDAKTAAENQRTALKGSLAAKRQQFYQKMAELFGEGGNDAAAADWLGKAGGLNNEIAANTRVAATPFTAKGAAFTPSQLENYLAGSGDMTVRVGEGGLGGDLDGTLLAGRKPGKKKEEEELLAVA